MKFFESSIDLLCRNVAMPPQQSDSMPTVGIFLLIGATIFLLLLAFNAFCEFLVFFIQARLLSLQNMLNSPAASLSTFDFSIASCFSEDFGKVNWLEYTAVSPQSLSCSPLLGLNHDRTLF